MGIDCHAPTTVQEYAYPVVHLKLVLAGHGSADDIAPQCCGYGEGCDVAVHGWKPSGVVLGLDGVRPLMQRRYLCKTHQKVFTVTSPTFCDAAYCGQQGYTWAELQPEPLVMKHGETYMTAEFLWDVVSMFEKRVSTRS